MWPARAEEGPVHQIARAPYGFAVRCCAAMLYQPADANRDRMSAAAPEKAAAASSTGPWQRLRQRLTCVDRRVPNQRGHREQVYAPPPNARAATVAVA